MGSLRSDLSDREVTLLDRELFYIAISAIFRF